MVEGICFSGLKVLLSTTLPPYFLLADGDGCEVEKMLRMATCDLSLSVDCRKLNGKRMLSLDGILDEFSAVYQFPEYFGYNWDALDECINDLDWINARAFVLILMNFDIMLAEYDSGDVDILVKVLKNACLNWKEGSEDGFQKRNTPFHVVIHTRIGFDNIISQVFGPKGIEFSELNIVDYT